MKKIIITVVLIIVIPIIIVNFFEQIKKHNFKYVENMDVRVLRSNGEIEFVPLEDYISGVIAGEMPLTFQLEALKAQAVAARSYVMKKIANNYKKEYDVVDTVMDQVYLDNSYLMAVWKEDYPSKMSKLKQAIDSTRGEYLDYKGSVVEAFFFSTSVGKTENSEEVFIEKLPYLRSVDSSFEEGVSPVFKEVKKFHLKDFFSKLGLPYKDEVNLKVILTTSTGRIKKIIINEKNFNGSDVVQRLNLRSNHFEIKQDKQEVFITTKGYGHGVGMSQYGAEALALKGWSYDKILKHYYLGVEIKKI